jgi:LacI family transcriptional regulator
MTAIRDNRSITLRDVAELAGVSLATASRVLSGRGYSSKESRAKVRRVAEQLGYKPNQLARNLKLRKTDTVGLMITDIVNPFYSVLANGALACAKKFGYHVILCATNEDEKLEDEYLNVLMNQRAAGIIAVPTGRNLQIWSEAYTLGVNLVLVDREVHGLLQADVVLVDNVKGAYEAVSYLIGLGHLRIGIITGPATTTTGKGRLDGYLQAMQAAGIAVANECVEQASFKSESGSAAAQRLLSLADPPTAIFAANNQLGEATYKEIRASGLTIPNDISLVVFDDVTWASLVTPPLTVVSQPTHKMGYLAMELLHHKLETVEEGGADIPRKSTLCPELIIRASCGKPPLRDIIRNCDVNSE